MTPAEDGKRVLNSAQAGDRESLAGALVGSIRLKEQGPGGESFPLLDSDNLAAGFSGYKGYFKIKDPGPESVLDVKNGDALTLEAWVQLGRRWNPGS